MSRKIANWQNKEITKQMCLTQRLNEIIDHYLRTTGIKMPSKMDVAPWVKHWIKM